jgi:PAS domain S-box-containing protein
MNNFLYLFALISIFMSSALGLNQSFTHIDNDLILDGKQAEVSLNPYLEILRDESGLLIIEDILNGKVEAAFIKNDEKTPNFGFQSVPFWVRFRVKNYSDISHWVLALNFANMELMDVYHVSPDTIDYSLNSGGVQRPFTERDYPINYQAFDLVFPPGSEHVIIIRFENQAAMTLPLTLWTADAFVHNSFQNQFVYGIFYGILVIMLLYNLCLWFFVRERSYLYLSAFILSLVVVFIFYDGFAAQYIQMDFDRLSGKMVMIGVGLGMFWILKFVNKVLDTDRQLPKIRIIRIFAEASTLVFVISAMILPYSISARIGMVSVVILFVSVLAICIFFSLKRQRQANFLLISLIINIFGFIMVASTRLGIFSSTPLTENTYRWGMIWMVIFWSITLADKIKTMESAVKTANKQLKANQNRLLQYLNAMPVGVTVYDTNLKPKFFNVRAEEMMTNPSLGLTSDRTINQSLEETINSLSIRRAGTRHAYPIIETAVVKSLKGEPASADDFDLDLGDRHLTIQAWSNPIYDENKEIEGSIVAFRDITSEREIENSLRRSEERFRTLVETMVEGLGMIDDDNILTYVNPSMLLMLGYSTGEMLGRSMLEFSMQDQHETILRKIDAVRNGERQTSTLTWNCNDQKSLHSHVSFAGVYDELGQYNGAIFIITDISEQIEASKLLEEIVAERTNELTSLLEVSRKISGTLEREPLLEFIFTELQAIFDFSGAAFYAFDDVESQTFLFPEGSFRSIPLEEVKEFKQRFSAFWAVNNDEVITCKNIQENCCEFYRYIETLSLLHDIPSRLIHSWMGVPIKYQEHLIGIFSVYHNEPDAFSPEMANLTLAFAAQTAVAIENARLFKQAQIGAAIKERNRLSQELHDSVTQALYSLILYSEASRLALLSGEIETTEKHLGDVITFAREAMSDLRLLIFELRPTILEDEGIIGALQSRLEAVEKRAGCKTECVIQGDPNLSPKTETELYWVVHEALNNVLKHSKASNVYLDIKFSQEVTSIILCDDGVGFDATNIELTSGIGMKTIAERVKGLNGTFSIESSSGQGTVLKILVNNP